MAKIGRAASILICMPFFLGRASAAPDPDLLGPVAVRPLPGFKCMQLKRQFESYDPNREIEVPILEQPKKGAKWIVDSDGLIIAKLPVKTVNGFIQVLCPNMRLGWIETRYVTRWHVPGYSKGTCTPSMMSNGYPGAK